MAILKVYLEVLQWFGYLIAISYWAISAITLCKYYSRFDIQSNVKVIKIIPKIAIRKGILNLVVKLVLLLLLLLLFLFFTKLK